MVTENGIVTQADSATAWVKTNRTGACESCSTKNSCQTAKGMKELTVTVSNTLNVKKGDHVVIGMPTSSMLFLTFVIYIIPVLMLLTGAIIGNNLAPSVQMDPSLLSMLTGFSFFALAFYLIRKKHGSMAKNNAYKPFLVRKRSQVIPSGCSTP